MNSDPIVIVSMARTPVGNLLGCFKNLSAIDLGTEAIRACVERGNIKPEFVDETIMGCVLPAGLGQAPARQAAIKAGIPVKSGAATINKMCGSGMKALMLAHDSIVAGSNQVVIAGGMESMTNAPHLLPKARAGYRLGNVEVKDHMMIDGLEDVYDSGKSMGVFAEATAEKYQFDRQQQDEFAIASLTKAQTAQKGNQFANEIVPITVKTKKETQVIVADENPQVARVEKIPQLRPAFQKDGTVTAANSSSISDGAASLCLMRLSKAQQLGLSPLAKISGHSTYSQEPQWFTTAPAFAIQKLLTTCRWNLNDVGLFEINEAFAVVTLATIKELELNPEKVNVFGGACALGHPIGASGARIVVTLINAMRQKQISKGVAALCIGGGEATAMAIELL